jgi:Trk K+ transport system NAD-binding subunit
VGTVSEKDVAEASQNEQLRRDLAGGFSSSITAVSRGKTVDLGDGYWLREILAPPYMFERSLAELGIGERTGVQVVLVRGRRSADGGKVRVAGALDRFKEGETLIVAGSLEGLNELEKPR